MSLATDGLSNAPEKSVADGELSGEEILAAFAGPIQPVRIGIGYRIGLAIVAFAMVLLPLVYVALIAFVLVGIIYHGVSNVDMLGNSHVNPKGRFMGYFGPLVIGPLVALFLIKPIVARRPRPSEPMSLEPAREPLLFRFVESICRAIGAPTPKRIDVDMQVNASASLRRGLLSFAGDDLLLTIGLPLIAGLDTRQFAAILAHEFGHFTQRTAMRLTFIVRSVSFWFRRVVYERDKWDVWIERTSVQRIPYVMWLIIASRAMIWLSRRILWCLMKIGDTISCYMLRQMEFDADRYAARLAGSEVERDVTMRMAELSVAFNTAGQSTEISWNDRRLPDNLPQLVEFYAKTLQPDVRKNLEEQILAAKTSWIDTHPAARERIASAEAEAAPGVFTLRIAARRLFADFDALAKAATKQCYAWGFGPDASTVQLVPTDKFAGESLQGVSKMEAQDRFFHGLFDVVSPLYMEPAPPPVPMDKGALVEALRAARSEFDAILTSANDANQRFQRAGWLIMEAGAARAAIDAKVKVLKNTFSVPLTRIKQIVPVHDQAQRDMSAAQSDLDGVRAIAQRRLGYCIALGAIPGTISGEAAANDAQLAKSHAELLSTLGPCRTPTRELYGQMLTLRLLYGVDNRDAHVDGRMKAAMREIRKLLNGLRDLLKDSPYPFEHAAGQISIADSVLAAVPDSDDAETVYRAADEATNKLQLLYARLLASVASYADRVEAAVMAQPNQTAPPPVASLS